MRFLILLTSFLAVALICDGTVINYKVVGNAPIRYIDFSKYPAHIRNADWIHVRQLGDGSVINYGYGKKKREAPIGHQLLAQNLGYHK